MKNRALVALLALALFACGGPSTNNRPGETNGDATDPNKVLYDRVMDIHDEVMPKMQDIEALKKKLKDRIAATPDMVADEREKLERRIANLDSVGNMMMDWMHKFSPLPDSLGAEAAREYFESEMEKIKQVRDAMLGIIAEEGKSN